MSKIINVEILGHPLNWLIIIGIVVFIWFALFAIQMRAKSAPADTQ
jgi:hypothetical protein